MTIRAIVLGIAGACAVCGFTYFNDIVLRQTAFIGNNMPVSIYGSLVLYLILLTPVLRGALKKLALSGKELAVVLAMILASCSIPGNSLIKQFTAGLMLPHYWANVNPGWKENRLIETLPPRMLADVSHNEDEALNGFVRGLTLTDKHISIADIPWYAWLEAWEFWLPLIVALWICLVGLSVVVHRQWADHEQLPYPIAQFTNSLLPGADGSASPMLHNRLFWAGGTLVLLFHLNNYAYQWFPNLILIPNQIDVQNLFELSPTMMSGPGGFGSLTKPRLYFTVVALAFFIPKEVSLSVGIGPFIFGYVYGTLAGYGISLRAGGLQSAQIETFLVYGAFVGMLLVLLYTGRHYYLSVLRRALLIPSRDKIDVLSVWGARAFLACGLFIVTSLVSVGLDWQLAVIYTVSVVMVFVVLGRITAETGVYYFSPRVYPGAIMLGVFGSQALGPEALLILLILTMILLMSPSESLVPFLVNSFKVIDLQKLNVGKVAMFATVAILLGLAVALPVTLYFQYDRGVDTGAWTTRRAPQSPFNQTLRVRQRLVAQGQLESANDLSGWERFGKIASNPPCIMGLATGAGLVLVFTAARLRFARWPFHPVMFLMWHSYPGRLVAASFLAGWLVKSLVSKYGGANSLNKLKPFMFGIIAGEMLGGILVILFSLGYHFITGELPPSYSVYAGTLASS